MNAEQLLQLLYQRGARVAVADGNLAISAPDGVIDVQLLPLLSEHKQAIMALVQALDANPGASALVPASYPAAYEQPASLAQQRMLFLEELADGRSYYNIPFACRLEGKLDAAALASALSCLLRTHDILRTVYRLHGDDCVQAVLAPAAVTLHERDLRAEAQPEQAVTAALAAEAEHRFDLRTEIPVRCALFALGDEEHVLSINIHHIAADGHSMRRLLADLGQAYNHYRSETGSIPRRSFQYADYASWQAGWMRSPQFDADRAYWVKALENAPSLHGIMTDYPRAACSTVAGTHYRRPLPPRLCAAVAAYARQQGTTPFAVYQAGFAALLSRYSGENDIVFGTAAANRVPPGFSEAVGLFVNTLALRYRVADDTTFAALVAQGKEVVAGAGRHQGFPFDVLVDTLQPKRDASYNPLVQIMLVMQDENQRQLHLDGLRVRFLEQDQQVSKFDFALHLCLRGERVELDWEYNTSLYRADTLSRLCDHFIAVLAGGLAAPAGQVGAITLVQPPQAQACAGGATPISTHVQFEQQVERQPDRVALRDGLRTLSYGELNDMAERVAAHLARTGATAGAHIGVCLERSAGLVAAMLGIYKMGGVYVPLDPNYPPARLAFMIEDSGIGVLLSDAAIMAQCQFGTRVPLVDIAAATTQDAAGYARHTDPAAGAYIVYTSGSTGKPKGVLVTQRNLFHSLRANREAMQISAADCLPTIGSQAFGVSLLEILVPLTSGGAVQLVAKAQVADIDELVRATGDVTVLHAVPSLMRIWLETVSSGRHADPYPRLRLLLVGGESVPDILLQKIKQWRPQLRLLELYGMTESTIVCSRYEATGEPGAHYCIGKPFAHAAFHVLNACGQEQPVGVPGELHIAGAAIAAGYINQPGLTRERFPDYPFAPGQRMYRTGDRVRRLADGNFEFLGRVDHQVSLRGARIELGEIETLANAVEGVNQAVAHVVEGREGEDMLVLSYTSSFGPAERGAVAGAIRWHLARGLPDYMQPSMLQCLDGFPLNPNGKVDRKNLPAPAMTEEIVEPATGTELRVLALAREVLQRHDFGVCANFFEIGGHSLAASKLVARIRSAFGIAFQLGALYNSPTVRSCAALVEAALLERYAASLALSDDALADGGDDMLI
jgi:amino acid adenylation domain-containing protein